MTNITLSIQDSIYRQMRKHSEIKWSELVRKVIQKYLSELESIEKHKKKESFLTMLASEAVLKKDWESPEEDEAWKNL